MNQALSPDFQTPEPLSENPVLEVEDLCVCYGNTAVLTHVNMRIRRGAITAIIGPSGCGKSSFLACLNRLTDLAPACRVDGCVRLDGVDLATEVTDMIGLRRRVGMIFQKPNPFPLSIRRNLDLPLRELGVKDKHERARQIEQALRQVGLWDEVANRLDESALSLSGGQQQRLCIARAIALNPEVLLMDEPCSALDPIASGHVETLIESLRGRYTVVIVTHNLAQARRISDETGFFWMTGGVGRLIEFGHTRQIFEQPAEQLTAAYVQGRSG